MPAAYAMLWISRCTGRALRVEYRERVFAHFLREYAAGPHPESGRAVQPRDQVRRMPGRHAPTRGRAGSPPDITRASAPGTGTQLLKAADASKDQSYFLHGVAPAALGRTIVFPFGELRKDEVRRRAHAAGFGVYRQAGQHRHLLHRRAALSGVPAALPQDHERADRNPGRQA